MSTIERTRVNADGSLGAFESVSLAMPDSMSMISPVVIGNRLYLVGCNANGASTVVVYTSMIQPDGTLGNFTRAPNMVTGVAQPCAARIGNYLYCFGGVAGSTVTNTVQRALIKPDGTLNPWEAYASDRYILPFNTAYVDRPVVYGNFFYLLSGYNSNAVQAIAQGSIR